MDKSRWEHIQTLFDSVMELEPQHREAYLDKACFGDEELIRELRSLMDADGIANEMLNKVSMPLDDDSTITIGTSKEFGPYKVVGKIGMGGMGIVYQAVDSRLDRRVAVKCLSPQLSMDENLRKRFVTEARAVSRLDHPNICVIFDIGETPDKQMYFTMPYYEGDTLKQRIKSGTLSANEVLSIATQIGEGLVAAHNQKILHRDIKPANIMLTKEGGLRILDFGVAKISGVENTGTGAALGTVAYMSPEQLKGDEVDKRTDIWSLGVILYEMFAGKRPFKGKYTHDIMYSVMHDELEDITNLLPDAPNLLHDIIQRGLDRDPEERYQTVTDMLNDLLVLPQRWSCADSVILKQGVSAGSMDSSASSATTNWDKATLETISRELTKYLGPMASIIVKKKSLEIHDMKQLCEKLAESLPGDQERKQFFKKIKYRELVEETSPSRSSSGHSTRQHKGIHYNDEDLAKLVTELTPFVGPIAGKLVNRISKTVPDINTLCERLTDYLEDQEKELFLQKTRSLSR